MNWGLIVTGVILLGCLLNGRRKGLIKTVFSLFSVIVSLMLTAAIAPTVSTYLQNNETLMEYVEDKVVMSMEEYLESSGAPLTEGGTLDLLLHNLSLPEGLVNVVTYVIVFLAIHLALIILVHALDIISKLPVLNSLNKTGGAIIGLIQGFLLVWILCIILTVFAGTEFGAKALAEINASPVLSYLYQNNLLLRGMISLIKLLK